MPDETRIDRWLCAVRLVKTRPIATQLCDGGHVRVNGNPAKPSTKLRAGDVVHALIAERVRNAIRPLAEFPLLGQALVGAWEGYRFVLGPWPWMLVVYEYDDRRDQVSIVTIQDARSAQAATSDRA